MYQDSNALVICFEHVDIKWYHLLITPLEFERQTSSAACFEQRVGKTEMKTKSNCASEGSVTLANDFFGVELYQLGTCFGISSNYICEELLSLYLFPLSL